MKGGAVPGGPCGCHCHGGPASRQLGAPGDSFVTSRGRCGFPVGLEPPRVGEVVDGPVVVVQAEVHRCGGPAVGERDVVLRHLDVVGLGQSGAAPVVDAVAVLGRHVVPEPEPEPVPVVAGLGDVGHGLVDAVAVSVRIVRSVVVEPPPVSVPSPSLPPQPATGTRISANAPERAVGRCRPTWTSSGLRAFRGPDRLPPRMRRQRLVAAGPSGSTSSSTDPVCVSSGRLSWSHVPHGEQPTRVGDEQQDRVGLEAPHACLGAVDQGGERQRHQQDGDHARHGLGGV